MEKITPELQKVVDEIVAIFEKVQETGKFGMGPYYEIGYLATEVEQSPEIYLTEEQKADKVDPSALLQSFFSNPDLILKAGAAYKRTSQQLTKLLENDTLIGKDCQIKINHHP